MSPQKKRLYLGILLNDDLSERFRFFREQAQLNTKETIRTMIIQATDSLGYLATKKSQEIAPLPLLEEPSPTKETLKG